MTQDYFSPSDQAAAATPESDLELVSRAAAGQTSAFEALVHRYFPRIYSIARAHLRSREGAEDLAQEVFLRVWMHLPHLKQPELFAPWLVRITRNLALTWCRNGQRASRLLPLVSLPEEGDPLPDTSVPSPREVLEQQELTRLLREAVDRLPVELREVVLLHYAEGLNKSEIGRTLGVHDSSVGRQLRRAAEMLRAELDSLLGATLKPLGSSARQAGRAAALVAAYQLLPEAARAAVLQSAGGAAATASLAATPWSFASIFSSGGVLVGKGKMAVTTAAALLVLGAGSIYYTSGPEAGPPAGSASPQAQANQRGKSNKAKESEAASRREKLSGSAKSESSAEASPASSAAPATLTGTVLDEQGRPLSSASLRAVSLETSSSVVETSASATGAFTLAKLPAGRTALEATAPGYVPELLKLEAPADGVTVRLASRGAAISGHVYAHPSGEGVPGCTVSLVPSRDGELPESFQRPLTVSTGALGEFLFERLPAGSYRLNARKGDRLGLLPQIPDPTRLSLADGESTEGIDLRVYAGHTIQGIVSDKMTSSPLEGAVVSLAGPSESSRSAVTGADGVYRLENVLSPSGEVELSVSREGYLLNVSHSSSWQPHKVPLRSNELTLIRDLKLTPAVQVSGTVRNMEGEPVPGARVSAYAPNLENSRDRFVLSGSDGKYSLAVTPYRNIRLQAESGKLPPVFSPTLLVEDVPLENVDLELGGGAELRGTVRRSDGTPAAGATVFAEQAVIVKYAIRSAAGTGSHTNSLTASETRADELGRYVLPVPSGEGLSVGALLEGVESCQAKEIIVNRGEVREDVDFQLEPGQHLAGMVVTAEGTPIEGADVSLHIEGLPRRNSVQTDSFGKFRFTGLPKTSCTPSAGHPQYGRTSNEGTFPTGRDDLRLVLGEKAITLIGTVLEHGSDKPVTSYRVETDVPVERDPNRPERFVASGFRPGRMLRIQAEGYARLSASMEPPEEGQQVVERTFRLHLPASLTGRVVEKGSGKPVEKARVLVRRHYGGVVIPEPEPMAMALSDASGRFQLEELSANSGEVEVVARRGNPGVSVQKLATLQQGRKVDVGEIEIGSGAVIRGRALRVPSLTPVAGLEIGLFVDTIPVSRATTEADGSFSFSGLSEGTYRVGSERHQSFVMVSAEGEGEHEAQIRLGSGTLEASVICGGEPAPANVTLNKLGSTQESRQMESEADGRFIADDLEPGDWNVSIYAAKGGGYRVERVEVREGERVQRTFVLPKRRVIGRVLEEGRPAAGILVSAKRHDRAGYKDWTQATSGLDGSFELELTHEGGHGVTARSGDGSLTAYADVDVPAEGDSEPVTLHLKGETGTLVSTALDLATGGPLSEAELEILGYSEKERYRNESRDANGTLTVPDIPPGTYQVRVAHWDYTSAVRTVEIRAGVSTEISDVLSKAGRADWQVRDAQAIPLAGVKVRLEPVDAGSIQEPQEAETDHQGSHRFTGLLPGEYRATATAEGREPVTTMFTVTAGQTAQVRSVVGGEGAPEAGAAD